MRGGQRQGELLVMIDGHRIDRAIDEEIWEGRVRSLLCLKAHLILMHDISGQNKSTIMKEWAWKCICTKDTRME